MKKSFAKLTAITLATTTLVAVAPFQTAEAVDSPIFSDHEVVEDESEKETEEADISTGFKTVADAVAAADAHLENDPLNNGYKIEKGADDLYYVQLTIEDTKVVPEEEAEETEEDVDFTVGFKTLADAVAEADAHLENDPLNNGYKIEKGADDLYYVQLTIEDTKVVPEVESDEETKEKVTVKKSEEKLPETGESSPYVIFGVAALTVLAGVGLVAPSFKKEN